MPLLLHQLSIQFFKLETRSDFVTLKFMDMLFLYFGPLVSETFRQLAVIYNSKTPFQ